MYKGSIAILYNMCHREICYNYCSITILRHQENKDLSDKYWKI